MAFVSINQGSRKNLSEEERDFLLKAIPLAKAISKWVNDKIVFLRIPAINTINPSLVLADMIIESSYGTHPVSQVHNNGKYSNNLSLLKVDELWQGKVQTYEGKVYKCYQDWIHFGTDYSDLIVFTKLKDILKISSLEDQINFFAKTKENPKFFSAKASVLLSYYDLKDLTRFN